MTKDISTSQTDTLQFRFLRTIIVIFIPLLLVLLSGFVFGVVYFDSNLTDLGDFGFITAFLLSLTMIIFVSVVLSSYVSYFTLRNDVIIENRGYLMGLITVHYEFARSQLQSWDLGIAPIRSTIEIPQLRIYLAGRCVTVHGNEKKLYLNNQKIVWDAFLAAFKKYVNSAESQREIPQAVPEREQIKTKTVMSFYSKALDILGIIVIGLLVVSIATGHRVLNSVILAVTYAAAYSVLKSHIRTRMKNK